MAAATSRRGIWLPVLAVLAVRLSLIGLFGPSSAPTRDDTSVYYSVSKALTESGHAWVQPGSEFGYRAPLYFIYLAGVFSVFRETGYRFAQVATSVLGAVTCVLLFKVLLTVAGRREGWVAFCAYGLLPFFVLGDTFVMSEPLFGALLVGAVLAFLSPQLERDWKRPMLLGFLVGLCMLTREGAVGYPLIFGSGMVLIKGPVVNKVRGMLLFLCGLTLMLLPWMWRNQVVWGHALPLSYTSGPNLYIGNNPKTTGKWVAMTENAPPNIKFGGPEASKWCAGKAVEFIRANPGQFMTNGFKKLAWLTFPSFDRDFLKLIYRGPSRLLNAMSVMSGAASAAFLLCAVTGFVLKKADRLWWLTCGLIAYHLSITFVAIGSPRLRFPLEVILIPFASAFAVGWGRVFRARHPGFVFKGSRTCALILAIGILLCNWAYIALLKS